MNENRTSVAVTGGAGFIGRHFRRRLAGAGRLARTIDIRPPDQLEAGEVAVVGDVRSRDALREALVGADAVLHLAAAHHDFGIDRGTFFSVNEDGAQALCDVMDELAIRSVCFYSTVAVYGSEAENPGEATPCRPDSAYGESKLAGERTFTEWAARGDGREVLIIRPTVTFGPGNFANMYTLIRQIASRLYIPVGAGTNRKSLVYIENIVDATLALWANGDGEGVRIYNAVDKPDLTSRQIAETIYRGLERSPPWLGVPMWAALAAAKPFDAAIALTGRNLPISSQRIRKFADSSTVFSSEKLDATGIERRVPLEVGIERMVAWYSDEGRHRPVDRSIPPPDPELSHHLRTV